MISRSNFSENAAFASLCDTANADGGNGGAIALIGLNEQRVVMSDVNFYSNFAMGKFGRGIVSLSTTSYSLGGAVLVTGGSVLLATRCNFSDNLAADGFGNDIVLVKSGSASAYADNSLNISSFRLSEVYSTSQNSALLTVATDLAVTACSTAKGFLKMSISSSVPFTASAKVVAGWESRNRGRRLSPTSIPILPNVPEFLITTSFSLLVLSGSATLIDLQSLSGSTHVGAFSVGDTSRSDISTYASQNLTFGGDMSQLQLLAISVFSSRLTLSPAVDGDGDREVTLRGLNMINSTLVISNNVTLIGDCVLINSAIIGDSSKRLHRESGYPVVRFVGKVTTGITLQVARTLFPALNSTGGKDLILEKFFLSKPLLSLTNCIAEVFSEMLLDRSLLLNYKSFLPTIAVHLIGEALLRIMPGGILRICDSTIIRNENKVLVSFENLGTIYLDPSQTSDHPNFLPPAVTNQPDFSSLGSAYSTLRLDCVASQSYDGSIVVYLGSDNFNHAIVHLFTNKSFTGTIKVNLANNTHLALPGYGGIYNSNWTLVKVDSVYSRDPDSLVSNAPSLLPTVRPVTVISRPPFLSFSPFQPLRPSKGVPTSADTSIPTSSGPTLSPVRSIFSSTGPTSFPAVQVSSLSQSQTNFVTASMSIDSSISEKWSNKEDIFATSSATVVKLNVTSNALFELIIKSEIPGVSFKTGMVVTSLPHIQSNHSYLNISSSIPHIRSRLFLDTHNSNILVSANITRSNSTHDMFNRSVTSAVMTLQVSGMSCTQLSTFYDSSATNSAQEMCTTCSTNSSCSYCGQGICAESGQCPAGSSAWSSCCAGGTCGSHGTCVGGAKDGYSCQCSFFYQLKSSQVSTNTDNGTPNTCSVLSTDGIAIIVSILAALVIACLSCLYYYYYRGKRRQFFDDLRDEVLGESEDISRFARTMSTSVPQGFIQNLQESLLLKVRNLHYNYYFFSHLIIFFYLNRKSLRITMRSKSFAKSVKAPSVLS